MTYHHLWKMLVPLYGEHEAQAIARLVFEQQFGLSFTDICAGKDTQLHDEEQAILAEIAHRLSQYEPVQYILGKAMFAGHELYVAPGVLIPRPETEQLCEWVVATCCEKTWQDTPHPRILDIGTGTGCIAITLALALTGCSVTAWDISAQALDIARENAGRHCADIRFQHQDILQKQPMDEQWHVIVSNPPYVCMKERDEMAENVLMYEPHEALFVPDGEPLLYYKAIADYARQTLVPGGMLFLEGNASYMDGVSSLLHEAGLENIATRNDDNNLPRFACATQPTSSQQA